MARWRDVKKGKIASPEQAEAKSLNIEDTFKLNASVSIQIKAVITDIFMLLMPLMYLSIYILLGGREGFAENMVLGWAYILIPYWIVSIIFLIISGQTPGLKAYEVKLVNTKNHKKVNIFQAILRQTLSMLNTMSIVGLFVPFFRKDRRTIQDIVALTTVITFPNK